MKPRFQPGDRIRVWISQRDDVREGDAGTVITVSHGPSSFETFYLDVILDTGIRLGHYHERAFIEEAAYDPGIPF